MKGEIQVSTKEREAQSDSLLKDISQIISERCINPTTGLPYTPSMIEKAINDLHLSIKIEQSAKQQALDVMKQLERSNKFPIVRLQTRIKIHCPVAFGKKVKEDVIFENAAGSSTGAPSSVSSASSKSFFQTTKLIREEWEDDDVIFELLIDPGKFKSISENVSSLTKGAGSVFLANPKE